MHIVCRFSVRKSNVQGLSTIVNANQILVMKDGEIIERGSHDELLQLAGEYKSVWDIQARESSDKPNV